MCWSGLNPEWPRVRGVTCGSVSKVLDWRRVWLLLWEQLADHSLLLVELLWSLVLGCLWMLLWSPPRRLSGGRVGLAVKAAVPGGRGCSW